MYKVLELIFCGIFAITFFVFLGKIGEYLTGLDLSGWIAASAGALWGTYFFARVGSWVE